MDSQRIVDYIADQLKAGYSEAQLRQHLMAHGWSSAAVDTAFRQYSQTIVSELAEQPVAKRHRWHVKRPKWTPAKYVKFGVSMAVLLVLATGGFVWWSHRSVTPQVTVHKLTYREKQSSDVVTLGGAIALYTSENGVLPTHTTLASDGNLVLCGATCNPLTAEVSSLVTYKAANVELLPYNSGLIVPNKDAMYIVPAATCKSTDELGGQSSNPIAAVILYARLDADGSLAQRCVTL